MFSLESTTVELYRAFHILNAAKFHNELPTPIITISPGKKEVYGHFTPWLSWVEVDREENQSDDSFYEINLNPATWNDRTPCEIIGTLLHEMVHLYNHVNDIKDCSNNRHNKKFKAAAESVGFIVEQSKKYGWGHTKLSDSLKKYIEDNVDPVPEAFEFYRVDPKEQAKEKKPRKKLQFKYTCPLCGLEIKGKKGITVLCGCSDSIMEMEDEDDDDDLD